MAAGKLPDTRRGAPSKSSGIRPKSAAEWAAAVRATFALDATDEELVTMGEAALRIVHDPRETRPVQLNAMGRFLAIVKQLALVAPAADAEVESAPVEVDAAQPPAPATRVAARQRTDPRNFLQAVK